MPITYEIDIPVGLIVTRCIGNITPSEVLEHIREVRRVWPPVERLDALVDVRDVTSQFSPEEVMEVTKEIDAQIGPHRLARCAVVANQEPLRASMYGFEALAYRLFDGGLQVFRTPEGARMWLELTLRARK